MNPQAIKAFIDAMAASDLTELEVQHDGWHLRLARPRPGAAPVALATASPPPGATPAAPAHTPSAAAAAAPSSPAAAACAAPAAPGAQPVQAPLYGIVHLQPAPGQPPFVQPGERVALDQVLCTVEAMKVFNELRADCAGRLQAVLVTSGQEVEAGQVLMHIVPDTDD